MPFKLQDDMYMIVPNVIKEKMLLQLANSKELYRLSFATLEEVKQHYFFEVKEEAILYVLETTKETLDVAKTMLQELYFIENTTYHHSKLERLKKLKEELIQQDLLSFDPGFLPYIQTKKVVVIGYPILEPYEQEMLQTMKAEIIDLSISYPLSSVIAYHSLFDEVVGVAQEIRQLNQQGISYHQMYVTGVDDSYFYTLQEVFHWFDIPINLEKKQSVLTTIQGKNYIYHKDSSQINNEIIKRKIEQVEANLSYAKESIYYDLLLEDALSKTYLETDMLIDAVHIMPEAIHTPYSIDEQEYLFVLGMNQNKIPKIKKDEDYLSDVAKQEVKLLSTQQRNMKEKQATIQALTSVKHLYMSYKETSLQELFYPSSLLNELHVHILPPKKENFTFSHVYNQYQLGLLLDNYYKYHEESDDLFYLLDHYDIPYGEYQHQFQFFPIPKTPLVLSYSQLDDYALCPFRYYVKYMLHLDIFEPSFSQKIGTIYHQVLSQMYQPNFVFEREFDIAIKDLELDNKEKFLLKRLKEELRFIVNTIQEQEQTTALKQAYVEKRLELDIGEIKLKGFIDKILFYEKQGKTYYAFFDYKTGKVELNTDYISYGLHMQLPIYLYLVEESHVFDHPVFCGFFYQMLLQGSKDEAKKKQDLKLLGYSTSDQFGLEILDENYQKSDWIRGLSITKDGALSTRSKTLSMEQKDQIKEQVYQKVKEVGREIQQGHYPIQPKILGQKNISCTYCPFQEICFHDVKDNMYIELKGKEEN